MSNNLKVQADHVPGEEQPDTFGQAANSGNAQADDAESQMRKALGLLGDAPRHRAEGERTEAAQHRGNDRFSGGGLHRRRFVQDGDVPVTVLRREAGHEAPAQRVTNPTAVPTSSRLQRVEAALTAETAAREKVDRALAESHAVVRDLQTKIGHAELARAEAVDALRREREAAAQLRQEAAIWQERLDAATAAIRGADKNLHVAQEQLAEEQRVRRATERTLKAAETARESTPALGSGVPEQNEAPEWVPPEPVAPVMRRTSEAASISPAIRRRRAAEPTLTDQAPVKWWLASTTAAKRR